MGLVAGGERAQDGPETVAGTGTAYSAPSIAETSTGANIVIRTSVTSGTLDSVEGDGLPVEGGQVR